MAAGQPALPPAMPWPSLGQPCILVEKEDRLGGAPILTGYAKLVPSGEWAKDAIGGMVDRVTHCDEVEVITGATVHIVQR